MNIRLLTSYATLSACFIMPVTVHAQSANDASQPDITSAIESLRADIRADKVSVIKSAMQFTPQESAVFWPIYNKYAADLAKVNDNRVSVVRDYADKYDTLSDADASALVSRTFSYEQSRLDIRKKYFKEFSSKLSGQTVAKFFQLEHRFDLLIDLELASRLPALLDKPVNP